MVETAEFALLFLVVLGSLLRHTKPRDRLRAQKAYSVQEANVLLTCTSIARALKVPNQTASR
jgi:hypothetical protein